MQKYAGNMDVRLKPSAPSMDLYPVILIHLLYTLYVPLRFPRMPLHGLWACIFVPYFKFRNEQKLREPKKLAAQDVSSGVEAELKDAFKIMV